jgi:hypothetical protein
MSVIERRRMVESIDKKMQQLNALGFIEVQVIAAMADYMPDFHHVMMNATRQEMDGFYAEYDGFFKFAKILEMLAEIIEANKVKDNPTVNKEDEIAKAIDLRVRQLESKGIGGIALLAQMVGHLPDFHWLWNTISDEKLAVLCREYTGFYRYATLMEEAAEAESKKTNVSYRDLSELPDSIKTIITKLLKEGAVIEQGLQSIFDEQHKRDMWLEIEIIETKYECWMDLFAEFPDQLRKANVPEESCSIMLKTFTPMSKRINQLYSQVIAKR